MQLRDFDIEVKLFLDAIYLRYHYDFRSYAAASLRRRLTRAVGLFDCKTLSQLQDRVLHEPRLFAQVLEHLTVQTGDMFRDPLYYRCLREKVVPLLRTYPSLKVWVAGCSSGEEVYSLAILLREEGLLSRTILYATDISQDALRRAEAGVYSVARVAGFTEAHRRSGAPGSLSEHYTAAYGNAVFDKSLRESIVFSDHGLATDNAFAEVHLVSCRNVLLYFDRTLRDRALGLFHESLVRKGFLGLGARESLTSSRHAPAFTPFAPAERIYQKRGGQ